jgi:apolipoprotein D and lipocalin family protein
MPKDVKTQVVNQVDIKRFMGDWFVIASIPTPFEKGVYNGLETYTWNEEEQRIDVSFTFRKDGFNGPKDEITQKGWIEDPVGKAHWKVQPFWPLKFDYLVIDLADDYSWTTVGVPDKSYVWIMARKHTMKPEEYQKAIERIRRLGYDLEKLKKVPQNGDKP